MLFLKPDVLFEIFQGGCCRNILEDKKSQNRKVVIKIFLNFFLLMSEGSGFRSGSTSVQIMTDPEDPTKNTLSFHRKYLGREALELIEPVGNGGEGRHHQERAGDSHLVQMAEQGCTCSHVTHVKGNKIK